MGVKRQGYKDVFSTTKTVVVGAFSFVAALAWRDFIKKCFETSFGRRDSIKSYALYSLLVTVIAIVVIWCLYKMM